MKKPSRKELLGIMATISQFVAEENKSLRENIARVDFLLKDSMEILGKNFVLVHASARAQQAALEKISADGYKEEPHALVAQENVLCLAKKINALASKSAVSFQVEDIVSQIITQEIKRTEEVDRVFKVIANIAEEDDQDVANMLEKSIVAARLKSFHNSVAQQSLDIGNTELF